MSSSSSSPSYSSESSDSDYKYSGKRKKRSKKTNAGTRNIKKPSGARQKTGSGSGQNATGDSPHHESGCCTSRPASTATTNDSRSVSSASASHSSAPSLPAASLSRSAAQSEPSSQYEALRKIRFAACLNTRLDCQLQVLYVKLDKSETNKSLHLLVGWNDSNNLNLQCAFCPNIEQQALKITTHINDEHPELIFAMNKSSLSQGNVLHLHCRHCPFVAVDSILMWVHFEFYHALPGILSGPLGVEVTPKPTHMQVFDSQQKVVVSPFYCCLDCGLLVADSRHGALHVVQTHGGDTDNFNGCFVRMNMYNKLPKSPSSGVTYANVLEDNEYKDLRREIFVCVHCTCYSIHPILGRRPSYSIAR